jgi:hypothetical protein
MNEQHNELMAYVLDEPEQAARELAKLRRLLRFARDWRAFQEEDSVADQQTDMALRSEANAAAGRLLGAIDSLDK